MAAVGYGDLRRPVDVVFLHANGFNALTYRTVLGPIEGLNILAIDQRGHGGTPQGIAAEGRGDVFDLRDDLLGVLAHLAADAPLVLAGHSLGGCVSLLAAAEAPHLVRGLALFDPVVLSREVSGAAIAGRGPLRPEPTLAVRARTRRTEFESCEAAAAAYRGRGPFATWSDQALADYVADGFTEMPGGRVRLACDPAWEASNFAAHGQDIWAAMSALAARVVILRADHGSTCALADPADFPGLGPIRIETVAGASHFLPLERPDLVEATLLELCAAGPSV